MLFHKTHHVLVFCYVIAILLLVAYTKKTTTTTRYKFLILGLIGQVLLFCLSYHIYKSQQIWYSFTLYALIYVLFVLSFTSIDMFLYLGNSMNFTGKIYKDVRKMFVDFVYINFCTVSTMGYSDISPSTTIARSYTSYKIVIAIFMIVFLISDINIKTK